MSPAAPPQPGRYIDRCGTYYAATCHAKTRVWSIQKLTGERGRPQAPFERADFPAAVNAGIFTYSPEPK